jgi:translation initiation factor 1A
MPRGRGKGGKNRKKAKNFNVGSQREITFKEEGQEYA